LRAVYAGLRVVATSLRYLRIVTSYLRKNHSVENRKKILTCQTIASPFTDPYGCLQVMTSYLRIPASYVRMLVIDYELAIRMTRKTNQCM